jgi:hypothetical protein
VITYLPLTSWSISGYRGFRGPGGERRARDIRGVHGVCCFEQAWRPSSRHREHEIDADQDPSTGLTSTIDGASGLGVDYTVTMVENEDGLYAISDSNQVVTAWVEPTFNSSVWGSVTVAVPLSALGGDVGNVNLAAAFGTLNERTDIVPNASHVVVALLSPQ